MRYRYWNWKARADGSFCACNSRPQHPATGIPRAEANNPAADGATAPPLGGGSAERHMQPHRRILVRRHDQPLQRSRLRTHSLHFVPGHRAHQSRPGEFLSCFTTQLDLFSLFSICQVTSEFKIKMNLPKNRWIGWKICPSDEMARNVARHFPLPNCLNDAATLPVFLIPFSSLLGSTDNQRRFRLRASPGPRQRFHPGLGSLRRLEQPLWKRSQVIPPPSPDFYTHTHTHMYIYVIILKFKSFFLAIFDLRFHSIEVAVLVLFFRFPNREWCFNLDPFLWLIIYCSGSMRCRVNGMYHG